MSIYDLGCLIVILALLVWWLVDSQNRAIERRRITERRRIFKERGGSDE